MPVRNAMPFLEECVRSILTQSYANWELIAVDDHSEDGSNVLLLEYAAIEPRIHCHQNSGSGIIDALNKGYSCAKGDFITRMDADDMMPSIKLEILLDQLQKSGRGHLSTGKVKYISETILGDGFKKYEEWLNALCDGDNHYQEIYKECVIPSPCWMMYCDDFNDIGGFNSTSYPEDYDLCFRMYENKIKIVASRELLHIWRDHNTRASRNDSNYSDNRFLDMKVKYFIRNDYRSDEKLVIWGAGKKGKYIAKLFLQNNINFIWITNNDKKIGNNIYTVILKDFSIIQQLRGNLNLILSVANKDEQIDIIEYIQSREELVRLYKFC